MKLPTALTLTSVARNHPRAGEFFAPLPLLALGLTFANDVWLKAAFHSALTGKLSDIGVCFFMPLFVSELLGILFGIQPRIRLVVGGVVTGLVYTAQEIVPPFTRFALDVLRAVGPHLGIRRGFQLTSDWTDLFCLLLIPAAIVYGSRRLCIAKDIVTGRRADDDRAAATT